jgi:3-isopropylmalate dehydrogenase
MKKTVALVTGDGSGLEMMEVACTIAVEAAKKDGIEIVFVKTPMGWNAYEKYGDTRPEESFKKAVEIGTIFFGGVGDPKFDSTIGAEKPEMKPEARCLLNLRKEMGLLLNFRLMYFHKELVYLANVRPETIPDGGVQQVWIRYLLEDSYFGNEDFARRMGWMDRDMLGVKLKKDVTGNEEIVSDIAYFRKSTIEKFARAAFAYAKDAGLPLISLHKENAMSRFVLWKKTVTRIGKAEFPDVSLVHQLVDSAAASLFKPAELQGVIICANEHGDILSDGAASALGSMGMMCSSAINPDTGAAMFESGAGTAPTLAGQNKANPIGRILTAAMMLRHLGAINGAKAIEDAVKTALRLGYRTGDMCADNGSPTGGHPLGTSEMGSEILFLMTGKVL